jgi:hypothetical protein
VMSAKPPVCLFYMTARKDVEKKRLWSNVMQYPGICLEGLRKTLSQNSRSPSLDLNSKLPEYEAGVLTTQHDKTKKSGIKYMQISLLTLVMLVRFRWGP